MNDCLADFIALEVNVRSLGCPSDLKTFTFLMCLGRTGCTEEGNHSCTNIDDCKFAASSSSVTHSCLTLLRLSLLL